MAIPTIPVYTGGVANPDGSQDQQEFTTNMFNQLSYEAALAPSLNNTVNEMNAVAGQVDTNAAIAQNSADAAQSSANFEGEFAVGVTNAEKGKSYSYNGEVWLCLQNTTTTPSQDAVEWKLSVGEQYVTTAQGDVLGGELFKGSNGETVENGDVVEPGITHLRTLVGGKPAIVAMTPISSGSVSLLTETSATIGGVEVDLLTEEMVYWRSVGDVRGWGAVKSSQSAQVDVYDALMKALNSTQTKTITVPDVGIETNDDSVPDEGFFFSQPIKVPLDKSFRMESPLIYTGSTFPSVVFSESLVTSANKPHHVNHKIFLYNNSPADWDDEAQIGVEFHATDFSKIDMYQIYGFCVPTKFSIDSSSFAYNELYWGQLRGGKISSIWDCTNSAYMNECRHYGGRFASTPVPAGHENTSRYGIIANTDDEVIENHTWYQPTFEIGFSGNPDECVAFVSNGMVGLNVISARTEQCKEWVARFTDKAKYNVIECTVGKVGDSVPKPISGRDPNVIDDQTLSKTNKAIIRWEKPYMDPVSVVTPEIHPYPSGTAGSVKGWFFVPSTDVLGARTEVRQLANLRPAGQSGVLVPAGSTRLAKRIKCNGANLILVSVDDNFADRTLIARCYDVDGNDLYDDVNPYIKNNIYGNSGFVASTLYGGSYDLGYKCGSYFALSVTDDVEFIDFMFGGNPIFELYSVSFSSPDGSIQEVDIFESYASSTKPAWADGISEGLEVTNLAYTGTGVHAWKLVGGAWYDIS